MHLTGAHAPCVFVDATWVHGWASQAPITYKTVRSVCSSHSSSSSAASCTSERRSTPSPRVGGSGVPSVWCSSWGAPCSSRHDADVKAAVLGAYATPCCMLVTSPQTFRSTPSSQVSGCIRVVKQCYRVSDRDQGQRVAVVVLYASQRISPHIMQPASQPARLPDVWVAHAKPPIAFACPLFEPRVTTWHAACTWSRVDPHASSC